MNCPRFAQQTLGPNDSSYPPRRRRGPLNRRGPLHQTRYAFAGLCPAFSFWGWWRSCVRSDLGSNQSLVDAALGWDLSFDAALVGADRSMPLRVGADRWSARTSGINESRPAAGTTLPRSHDTVGGRGGWPWPGPLGRMDAAHEPPGMGLRRVLARAARHDPARWQPKRHAATNRPRHPKPPPRMTVSAAHGKLPR